MASEPQHTKWTRIPGHTMKFVVYRTGVAMTKPRKSEAAPSHSLRQIPHIEHFYHRLCQECRVSMRAALTTQVVRKINLA